MKPKPTPKPVNKNLNQVKGNQDLKEYVIDISNPDFEVIQEELDFHKEKFDTHRDKINEIATELNGLSEQAHERFLDLAKINAAISQVLDNQEAELKGVIRWHRFFLCVIAVIQVFMMVKLALNK